MTSPRPVLFDLDGTLIDSIDLIVDSYQHVFRTHHLPMLAREEIVEGIGRPLSAVFGAWTNNQDVIAEWIATYRSYNLAHHDERIGIFPGIREMLNAIHAAGRPLGVVTSKNHSGAERGLALLGVRELFSVIIGADDVIHPKPHPEPVEKALATLGATPVAAWYIGDSHHDIESGNAAGTSTIGVTWGPVSRDRLLSARPTHLVDTPDQLLDHLGVGPHAIAGRGLSS